MTAILDVPSSTTPSPVPTIPPRPHLAKFDRPVVPALILLGLATGFVLLRLADAAHGNISAFVVAGSQFTSSHGVPHGLVVMPGAGYDGQFYYRFALSPFNQSVLVHGIHLDTLFRRQRIGYSILAWLVGFGQPGWIPAALVIVNVVGLGALGFLCGMWARSYGRHAMWGLLPAGYFGLVWSLSRDLTEITAVTFMVAGLVAVRSRRPILAAVAFSCGVLCRETIVVVVIALCITRVLPILRRMERPSLPDVAWLAPLATYGGWEVIERLRYGTFPLFSDRGNSGLPFVAVTKAVIYWLQHPNHDDHVQLIQMAVVASIVVLALCFMRSSSALPVEKLAFVLTLFLMASLSGEFWNSDPNQFRGLVEVFVLGCGILFGARRTPLVVLPAVGTAFLWLLIASLQIARI
jgi:hypothetical protein